MFLHSFCTEIYWEKKQWNVFYNYYLRKMFYQKLQCLCVEWICMYTRYILLQFTTRVYWWVLSLRLLLCLPTTNVRSSYPDGAILTFVSLRAGLFSLYRRYFSLQFTFYIHTYLTTYLYVCMYVILFFYQVKIGLAPRYVHSTVNRKKPE